MKIIIRILGTLLAIVKLATASDITSDDPYLSNNILQEVRNISIEELLDYGKISVVIKDEFDKARFYYIIAYEIDRRKRELDEKFIDREIKYQKEIANYENKMELTPYQYSDERPRFDYVYQRSNITHETISNDIHRIQAVLSRTQFLQLYQYYRRRLDNYNNYLITLRELYKCKIIENNIEDQVTDFSNFQEMHDGIKLFHHSMDDAVKLHVQRDVLGKVLYIDWQMEGESEKSRRREFEYFDDGLLLKLTDKINNEVHIETLFGGNEMGSLFIEYLFTPGFIPQHYTYYTEIFYYNNRASVYKFISMNGHVIGIIYKEFDDKDHLIREAWCKGETSKILREFTSIFDPTTGDYKLIERDRNGKIVTQEIVLSSMN